MACNGQGADGTHCCFIVGGVCPFLRDDVSGRRWACGLLVELGSWEAVHADPRWVEVVKPTYDQYYPGYGCGDWPQNIPEVIAAAPNAGPFYTCCWGRGNLGDVD